MGDFAQCDGDRFPKDFTQGATLEACVPFLASGDAAVTGAVWQNSFGETYQDKSTGVTWTS